MGPTITMRPDEEKAGLATGELQKAFPPHLPPETEADRTPRGSLLACMTASREPSNQSFEFDREATVCSASRRFFSHTALRSDLSVEVFPKQLHDQLLLCFRLG